MGTHDPSTSVFRSRHRIQRHNILHLPVLFIYLPNGNAQTDTDARIICVSQCTGNRNQQRHVLPITDSVVKLLVKNSLG